MMMRNLFFLEQRDEADSQKGWNLWDAHVKLKQINIKYDYQIVFSICSPFFEKIIWHTFSNYFIYIWDSFVNDVDDARSILLDCRSLFAL